MQKCFVVRGTKSLAQLVLFTLTQPSIQRLVGFRATAVHSVTRSLYVTGMRFGLMQVKVGLISFLANYEVRISEKTPIPPVLDTRSFLLQAKGGMWLTIVNRKT